MRYSPPSFYPIPQEHFKRYEPSHQSFSKKGILFDGSNGIKISSPPLSVKEIDEEIHKLNQQYQLIATRSADKIKDKNWISTSNSVQTAKIQKYQKPELSTISSQHKIKLQQLPLASIGYLMPHYNSIQKNGRDSQSTAAVGEVNRSLAQTLSNFKHPSEQSSIQLKNPQYYQSTSQNALLKTQRGQLETLPNTANKSIMINESFEKTANIEMQMGDFVRVQQNEVLKTTKPTSQIMRIKQSPSTNNLVVTPQKTFQRKNNHRREQSNKYRQLSLPHITSTKLSNEGGSYIEAINEKSKAIVQMQSTILKLQRQIEMKQEQLQRYKFDIATLKENKKLSGQASNKLIQKLKKEIELNNVNRHSTNMDLQSKFHKINLQNQQISFDNNSLQRQINNLKKQLLKKNGSEQINQTFYSKLRSIISQKTSNIAELEKALDRMTDENNALRKRISEIINGSKSTQIRLDDDNNQAFNSILKIKEEQNISYKNNLSVKDQEIHRLEDLNRELKAINETLRNDIEIEKLKRMTELKNLETTFQIEEQVKVNEISSLNRTFQSLEEKLKYLIQENRRKDEFMVEYLRNRAQAPQDKLKIEQFFRKFQLLSVNTNIIQCLKRQHNEIDQLKKQIRQLILRK